jgi:Leucine-rich repeat (LRR) protein
MPAIAAFSNLRYLDLSNTAVTSTGIRDLVKLDKLESLNLTQTRVTRDGAAELQNKPGLKRLYLFEAH